MFILTALNSVVVLMAYFARFEKQRYLLGCAFLLLSLVLGIRYNYGNDYMSYYKIFNNSYTIGNNYQEYQEYGWYLLNCLFHPFGFYCFVFFLTCIENFIIYKIINKYISKEWYWLAVFLYVFCIGYLPIGLSMMRQFLAMCIGLYSLKYIEKRELIPFLLLCLLASSFHTISLLLFPLYLIPYINKLLSNKYVVPFIFIGIYLLYFHMAEIVFNALIGMKENELAYANTSYVSAEELSEEKPIRLMHIIRMIIYIVLLIRNFKALNNSLQVYSTTVVFGYLMIPFATFMRMVMRASWLYTFAEIVALPSMLSHEKKRIIKVPFLTMYTILVLYEYSETLQSPIYATHYMHYHTIIGSFF